MSGTKSIAVPPKSGASGKRRGAAPARPASPPPAEAEVPATARTVARPTLAKPAHRYHIGQRLHLGNGGNIISRAAAFCTVVSLLPYEGRGSLFYRVRSESEQFERVVAEGDLSPE
ncbi:MAG: hypothetical protein ABL879_10030 [Devosia sp.]